MKALDYIIQHISGGIEEIIVKNDDNNFRWTRKPFGIPKGLNFLSESKAEENKNLFTYEYFNGLILDVVREKLDGSIVESYTLKNPTEKAVDIDDDYYIQICFADSMDIEAVALPRRAYLRVYLGGNSFCVYNSKLNGDNDGVGLVLNEGIISKVEKQRASKKSTTMLNCYFEKRQLAKDEEISFSWKIFAYESDEEFVSEVNKYMPFVCFKKYPIIKGEENEIITDDKLFIDGLECSNKKIVFNNACLIKAVRGDTTFEFLLTPLSRDELARKVFDEYPICSDKYLKFFITKKAIDAEFVKAYLQKQNKYHFDMLFPFELINGEDMTRLFLKKCNYILKDDKGVFYPYNLISKYLFLQEATKLEPQPLMLIKLDELTPLVKSYFRLNYTINIK